MALDPLPVPEILLEPRQERNRNRPLETLDEKGEDRKKRTERRRRTRSRRRESSFPVSSTVPREIGTSGYKADKEGLLNVYEMRRTRGLSMNAPPNVTEFLEANPRIPRELVHRSTLPREMTNKRPARIRLKKKRTKKKQSTRTGVEREPFLREESAAISDITFENGAASSPRRRASSPRTGISFAVDTADEDQRPLVLAPIDMPMSGRGRSRDTAKDRNTCRTRHKKPNTPTYPDEVKTTERVDYRYRRQPRDRLERLDKLQHTLQRPQTRKRIEKALQRRRREPNDIWDLLREDAAYDVVGGGLPPSPSLKSVHRSDSDESTTSYHKNEPTLDISDLTKTTDSLERLELVRSATKADKELLERLLNQDSQRPPLDHI